MSNVLSDLPPALDAPFKTPRKSRPLRLWPAVAVIILLWIAIKLPAFVNPGSMMQFLAGFWSPMVATLLIGFWWLFLSRAEWFDRLVIPAFCIFAAVVAGILCHESYRFGLLMFALPWALTLWVGWLVLTPFLAWPARRVGLLACLALVWGYSTLVRMDGIDGAFAADVNWRWAPTAEDKFLASLPTSTPPKAAPDAAVSLQPGDWPAFRGAQRDNHLPGVRIAANWTEDAPTQRWRKRIGPGWSSFVVVGKNLYTQEQRGQHELVVCYHTDSGEERWVHQDETRFTEAVAGPGPRATPTFHEGKLYTLGANGTLNCLDAASGKLVWTRDIVKDSSTDDAKTKIPNWGFSSSPLIAQGVVIVFAGGPEAKEAPGTRAVLGYKAATGDLAWTATDGKYSYCSAQLNTVNGVEQALICTDAGLSSYQPADGKLLWRHEWQLQDQMSRVIQPAQVGANDFLIGTFFDLGTRRVRVKPTPSGWNAEEAVWTSRAIKPYYNDFVVHKGDLYGFDGLFFVCVNLEDGTVRWKTRGYGNGQVLLLPDQDLLVILGEKGQAATVEAKPEKFTQLGQFQAIEGKTWNHPVIAHGKLFVRNGEEIACYQLKPLDAPKMVGD